MSVYVKVQNRRVYNANIQPNRALYQRRTDNGGGGAYPRGTGMWARGHRAICLV